MGCRKGAFRLVFLLRIPAKFTLGALLEALFRQSPSKQFGGERALSAKDLDQCQFQLGDPSGKSGTKRELNLICIHMAM
jgi:hypothetical protein